MTTFSSFTVILPGIYGICKVIKLIYRYYHLKRNINSHFNTHNSTTNNDTNNSNNNTSVTLSLNSIRSQENELLSDFD